MAEILDFNSFKVKKEREQSLNNNRNVFVESTEESFYEYVEMMRIVVTGQTIKTGKIFIDCTSEDTVIITDEQGNIIEYQTILAEYTEADTENEDLIIGTITYVAPSNIIIKNSTVLNKHLLYAITQIYGTRVTIES
jgi:hypothetical protein